MFSRVIFSFLFLASVNSWASSDLQSEEELAGRLSESAFINLSRLPYMFDSPRTMSEQNVYFNSLAMFKSEALTVACDVDEQKCRETLPHLLRVTKTSGKAQWLGRHKKSPGLRKHLWFKGVKSLRLMGFKGKEKALVDSLPVLESVQLLILTGITSVTKSQKAKLMQAVPNARDVKITAGF